MSVTPLHSWPTRTAVLVATKNERKIPQMKGKNGRTVERQAQKNPTGNRAFSCFPVLSWWL